MIIQLVGFSDVNYTNKSGRQITGVTVYGVDVSSEEDNLTGHRVFEQFISGYDSSDLVLGELYEVEFTQYRFQGRFESRVTGLTLGGEVNSNE